MLLKPALLHLDLPLSTRPRKSWLSLGILRAVTERRHVYSGSGLAMRPS